MATHSSILAWKIHGQRSLVGCSPWGCKESGTIERLILTVLLKGGVQAARQSKANKEAKLVVEGML